MHLHVSCRSFESPWNLFIVDQSFRIINNNFWESNSIGFFIFVQYYSHKFANDLLNRLSVLVLTIFAFRTIESVREAWFSRLFVYSIFFEHAPLTTLSNLFAEITSHLTITTITVSVRSNKHKLRWTLNMCSRCSFPT